MNYISMIAFLRFLQRVQGYVKTCSDHGQISTPEDIRRCAKVMYAMSFDKNGNLLVDR